jgi:quinol monooxygenase YgiN
MRHTVVTSCQLQTEKMKEFFSDIQQWEQAVMEAEDRPDYHALYVNETDPSRVLLFTRFESRDQAEAFAATGLLESFRERILSCAVSEPHQEAYDLYYAVGSGGPRVIFGEDSDSG